MYKQLILFVLLCTSAFAQVKVEVETFSAITAKSAKVEPLQDKVAVFLTERDSGEKPGAFVKIISSEKWAIPFAITQGVELSESSVPGTWLMFAKAGTYGLVVVETDAEGKPKFTNVTVKVGNLPPPEEEDPDEPPPVDPPVGDFAALEKLTDELADKLADPPVRTVLANAYKAALNAIEDKNLAYDEAVTTVAAYRFAAMSAVPMTKDWNGAVLKPVGIQVGKLVTKGDLAQYVKAIDAMRLGLEK